MREVSDPDEEEYDSDGNVVSTFKKREIIPLSPVDHSAITYVPFKRNFYVEHREIKNLPEYQISKLRHDLDISVSGVDPPPPFISFAHLGLDESLLDVIRKQKYHTPTPIQSQAIPIALSGRDLLGLAQTGSGKTVAYLIPLMVHVINQPEIKEGDGPIGLICTPTRELCQQVYHEAKILAKAYNLTVTAVYGGANKHAQELLLKSGTEILVATPVWEVY
ncbi:hypothetical protein MXB_40 [Myxobolus squamalis]|nr:hypothetical protein MXB_40 [Myxobolus squamalis]